MKPVEQIRHFLARSWRWAIRARTGLESSLREGGLPSGLAATIAWAVALSISLLIVYLLWWLVLAVAVVLLLVRASARDAIAPPPPNEWRDGFSGVGLYDQHGNRIDPHDPDSIP